jgi:hypothetical protein
MERHGIQPSRQHCSGEISDIDKMERDEIWEIQRCVCSFKFLIPGFIPDIKFLISISDDVRVVKE